MTDFPSLAQVLARHESMRDPYRRCQVCICDRWSDTDHGDNGHHTHVAHQADAWREACTIRTVEELEALPDGATVRGANGHAFEKSSESWTFDDRRWGEAGNSSPDRSEDIKLPALLIWHPEWERWES